MLDIVEIGEGTVTLKKEDYERLVLERDEYKAICHEFSRIKKNLDSKIKGSVINE